jgi:hypothetical protein
MARLPQWSIPFANDGGPLIVLPRELLDYWHGSEGEPARENFPFGPDYARACEATYPADLIKVGPGFGLVVGAQDHVHPCNWLWLPESGGVALVGWSYAEDGSKAQIVELLRAESSEWQPLSRKVGLSNGDLVLFHAACNGEEVQELETFGEDYAVIGDGIPFRLRPGGYILEVMEVGGDLDNDPFGCVICRWVPLGRAG